MSNPIKGLGKWKLRRLYRKVWAQTSYVINAHILNPLWNSREQRRAVRTKCIMKYLNDYMGIYHNEISSYKPSAESVEPEPERAFSMWLQGEESAPPLVKACFRSMRRNLEQPLVVLDEKTLFDWISLPDHIVRKWREGKMGNAHFSDICRIELLYQHGGIWVDATDYVTGPVPSRIMDADFFVYMAGESICGWYGYIQNCFIRAHKGDSLLGLWRNSILTYWEHEYSIIDYFAHQYMFRYTVENNPEGARLFAKMPRMAQEPTHLLWFDHKDEPYDEKKYKELTKDAFFQKTTYKNKSAFKPIPGTLADHMING